jgi:hypothetical protein
MNSGEDAYQEVLNQKAEVDESQEDVEIPEDAEDEFVFLMMHKIETKGPLVSSFENIEDSGRFRSFLESRSDYLQSKLKELPYRGRGTDLGSFFSSLREIYPARRYPLVIIWDEEEDLVEEIDGVEIHSCRAKLLEDSEEAKKPFRFTIDSAPSDRPEMGDLMEFFDSLSPEEFRIGLPTLEITEALDREQGPTEIDEIKESLKQNSDIHATEYIHTTELGGGESGIVGESRNNSMETVIGEVPAKKYHVR